MVAAKALKHYQQIYNMVTCITSQHAVKVTFIFQHHFGPNNKIY